MDISGFKFPPTPSFQIADVRRDSLDLRIGQTVSHWGHDRGRVWLRRILPSLFAPVDQFIEYVIVELPREAGDPLNALGVGTVARGTGSYVRLGHSILKYSFPRGHESLKAAAQRWRIKSLKISRQSVDHAGAQ